MATARRWFTTCTMLTIIGLLCVSHSSAQVDPESIDGLWLFDEGSGALATDSSEHGYDADLHENPTWVQGRFGDALEFQGSDYLEVRNSSATLSFGSAAPFSITAWVKNQGGGVIVSKFNSGVVGAYIFRIGASGIVAFHREVDPWSFSGTKALPSDDFGHIAVTYDGAQMSIYINGELDASQERGPQSTDSVTPVLIGAQFTNNAPSEFFNGVLDEVAIFSVALTEEQIREVMSGLASSKAVSPIPEDGATDVARETSLSWTAPETAVTHNVYFGADWADVNAASPETPLGVLVSEAQTETTYTPEITLEYGETYFWRVDEVNGAPDYTVFKGNVWSFTVEPFAYPIQNIIATSNAVSTATAGPENTVNGSGLNANDEHSTESTDMWLGTPETEPAYIQYEFDGLYKLDEMLIWNYNVRFELFLGLGVKGVTVEYSVNGTDWTSLGNVELNQGTTLDNYTANTTIDLAGVAARHVRLIVTSAFGAGDQYGLSEVRFLHIPVQARDPQPADGDTEVSVAAALSWRTGRQATSHEVHLGDDPNALTLAGTVNSASYTPDALDLDATYYWRVDAVQDAESWEGPVWSFSTQAYLVVDDFESYTDDIDAGQAIFLTWIDGYEMPANGSMVGHIEAPFAEQSIVNSGGQSMPLFYDNSGTTISEAELALAQNWTESDIKSLSLYFHGAQGNTGQLYVKINNTKVVYDGAATDIAQSQWQPWNIDLSTVGGNLSNVATLIVGVEGAGAAGVLYIDDIRLYPKTPEFVTPVEPDAADLVLHYALDDGAGMVAADSSGNGNDGTIDGNPAWITGVSGGALAFDGNHDYVTTGTSLLNDLTEFTIACWLKGDLSLGNRSGLIGQNDCVEYGVSAGNNIQIWTAGSGAVNFPWSYDADADWHHIVAVGDGSSVTIYLDGSAAISGGTPITETYGSSAFPVNIAGGGVFDATDNWFIGQIDEVYIYQRALSAAEVAALAGRTEPLAIPF